MDSSRRSRWRNGRYAEEPRRTRRTIDHGVAALVAVASVVSVMAVPVAAHRAKTWYGTRWATSTVEWRFDADFPKGGGVRRAVIKGSRQWNHAGAGLRFRRRSAGEAGPVDPCALPRSRNFVQWDPIDGPGDRLAVTTTCTVTDGTGRREMYSFQMMFDSEENWHTDPSSQPLPFEVDLWAVASHEFGHAGGRITGGPDDDGHFSETSPLCPDVLNRGRHTMCPSYDVIGVFMRSLERHDIDTFRRAYGRR